MVAAAKEEQERKLTLLGQLQEIRRRLVYCTIALIITIAISWFLTNRIITCLESYVPEGTNIAVTAVTELFGVWFKVCLYSALVMALPFFILQLILFIRPALTRKERAYLYLLMPAIVVCFLGGAAFAWYIFMPNALDFLLNFGSGLIDESQIKIGNLISFEVQIIFWMGVVFELPVLTFFLAKIGVLNYRWLAKQWKWAFIGSFVVGAVITPTPDPINCTIVSLPIYLLYLLSIATAWLGRRGKKSTA